MHISVHDLPRAALRDNTAIGHFGPALVVSVLGRDVEIELSGVPQAVIWARLATSCLYRPCAGDIVLAAGTPDAAYVIGVLEASGPAMLEAAGDLEIRAQGRIMIAAGQQCTLASGEVRIEAGTLDLIGTLLRAQFETVRQRVSGLLETSAREICLAAAETCRLTARRITGRGRDSVTIDSPAISLG